MAKKQLTPKKSLKKKLIRPGRPILKGSVKDSFKQPLTNPTGRPREWTDELIAIETEALINWINNSNNYFFTNFLVERDLDVQHLERFCRYSDSFRQAYEKAKKVQECRLVALAVTKKGDGGFIKFILQNKAGWKEKNEISGDASNPLSVIMDRIGATAKHPLDDYDDGE